MLNGYIKPSRVAVLIASCSLLTGCGGSDGNTSENRYAAENIYAYNNKQACIDTNFDGLCNSSDLSKTELKSIPLENISFVINSDGYFLTANGTSLLVSPFTTLIQNEVLFNPYVEGNAEKAKQYLQKVLGNKLGINFTKLDSVHGPKEETKLLLKSFRHALSLSGDLPYPKISAAVDKMISFKTLDITDKLTQNDLDAHTVNLNNRYFSSSSYSVRALISHKSLSVNPNTGTLLAITSENKLLQVNLHNGTFIEFSPSDEKPASNTTTNLRRRHHDDDLSYIIANLMSQTSSKLTKAVQGKSAKQYYLVFQPTSSGNKSFSNTCNPGDTGSTNGIFLTHLGNKKKNKETVKEIKPLQSYNIDSYGGASKDEDKHKDRLPILPIIKEPEQPASDAKCINNNINGLIPIYAQNQVAAIFTSEDKNNALLQLLNSETLSPTNITYSLNTANPHVEISNSQSKLLLIQGGDGIAMILDTANLAPLAHVSIAGIKHAKFVNNDLELLINTGNDTIQWLNTNFGTEILSSLQLDSTVKSIASDSTGNYSAVLTSKTLYLVDNKKKDIITSTSYGKSSVHDLQLLKDKIVIVRKGAVDTFTFNQLIGSPIKVGSQIISKELVIKWGQNSSNQFTPTTLAHILRTNGEDDEISSQFEDVDIEWLPNNANKASDIKTVIVSGYFRNERINLYKNI